MDSILSGIFLVTLAGLGTGAMAWPIKKIKGFQFEIFLFVSMLTGIIIVPWAVVFINVPDLQQLISHVGYKPLFVSNLLSLSWGVANVLYLICVIRIGAALTGAILSALGMTFGVIIPMVIKGSGLFNEAPDIFSKTGMVILIGLAVLLLGVALMSAAGFGREKLLKNIDRNARKERASGNFLQGLILVILAGILSCGISLAFVYSQAPVIAAVQAQGSSAITANFAVWALGMLGGGLVNILYAIYLMTKNRTWKALLVRREEVIFGVIIGFQFILAIVLMGEGMLLLGTLGASVGFAIQQSMQIIGNQAVGFIGGEWKGVTGQPRKAMYGALIIILIAVSILAYSNSL